MERSEIMRLANAVFDHMQTRNWTPFIDLLSETNGISCFSEKNDSILMWSHYADSHKGIVLGIDSTKLSNVYKVEYVNSHIKIPLSSISNAKERRDSMIAIMTSKFENWQSEDEWRIIHKLPSPTINDLFILPIRPAFIKELYFGIKSSNDFKDRILNIIKDKVQCNVFVMKPSAGDFSLERTVLSV